MTLSMHITLLVFLRFHGSVTIGLLFLLKFNYSFSFSLYVTGGPSILSFVFLADNFTNFFSFAAVHFRFGNILSKNL